MRNFVELIINNRSAEIAEWQPVLQQQGRKGACACDVCFHKQYMTCWQRSDIMIYIYFLQSLRGGWQL